jgi:hypothetical protein
MNREQERKKQRAEIHTKIKVKLATLLSQQRRKSARRVVNGDDANVRRWKISQISKTIQKEDAAPGIAKPAVNKTNRNRSRSGKSAREGMSDE